MPVFEYKGVAAGNRPMSGWVDADSLTLLAELLRFRLWEPERFGASIPLIPSEQVELSITMLPAATLARPTPRHHLNRPRLSGDPGAFTTIIRSPLGRCETTIDPTASGTR